jgi:hypothetical protein
MSPGDMRPAEPVLRRKGHRVFALIYGGFCFYWPGACGAVVLDSEILPCVTPTALHPEWVFTAFQPLRATSAPQIRPLWNLPLPHSGPTDRLPCSAPCQDREVTRACVLGGAGWLSTGCTGQEEMHQERANWEEEEGEEWSVTPQGGEETPGGPWKSGEQFWRCLGVLVGRTTHILLKR